MTAVNVQNPIPRMSSTQIIRGRGHAAHTPRVGQALIQLSNQRHVSQHRITAMKVYAARTRKNNDGYLPFAA